MRTLNLIISKFLIFFLGASLAFDFLYDFLIASSLEFCSCKDTQDIFLVSEITILLFIIFANLVVLRLKLCLSNKLALIGLYLNSALNILMLTIDIPYEYYVSILNQISITTLFVISVLYLLKRKE